MIRKRCDKKNKKMNFLDFKPMKWGKHTKKTSQEIDKILYGK